jgi:hypothetical protein
MLVIFMFFISFFGEDILIVMGSYPSIRSIGMKSFRKIRLTPEKVLKTMWKLLKHRLFRGSLFRQWYRQILPAR